jgi:glutathione S-transferase
VALTFYYGAGSPYAWRVWLALEHKHLSYERVTLSFANRETHTPEYTRINPRGKVPAIRDGELTLYESAAIVEYLEERYPDTPRLFPSAIDERAVVRRVIHEVDTYVARAVTTLGGLVFRSGDAASSPGDQAFMDHAAQCMRDELDFFERVLVGDYLSHSLSAADLALYPLFAMIPRFELRRPELAMSPHIGPRVRDWMRRIEALPYFETTYPAHWRS